METKLKHPAVVQVNCWPELLTDCLNLSTFCGRIDRIAKKIEIIPINASNDFYVSQTEELSELNVANKFKGDVFEIFCELIIRMSPIDDRIGISDYHVITEGDTGVDGYGIGRDGKPVTVQCKFRLWDYELTAIHEHLNNFRLTSYQKFGIPPGEDGKMIVFTTGKEIHYDTLERQFLGKIRCISNNASYGCLRGAQKHTVDDLFSLKTIVNDNVVFWDQFRKAVVK
jgi:hypothetical protein